VHSNNIVSAYYLSNRCRRDIHWKLNIFLYCLYLAFLYDVFIKVKCEKLTQLSLFAYILSNFNGFLNEPNPGLCNRSVNASGTDQKLELNLLPGSDVISFTIDLRLNVAIAEAPHAAFGLFDLPTEKRLRCSLKLL